MFTTSHHSRLNIHSRAGDDTRTPLPEAFSTRNQLFPLPRTPPEPALGPFTAARLSAIPQALYTVQSPRYADRGPASAVPPGRDILTRPTDLSSRVTAALLWGPPSLIGCPSRSVGRFEMVPAPAPASDFQRLMAAVCSVFQCWSSLNRAGDMSVAAR